ncbi:MAG: hypothetical protein PQJ59_18100 [Spirochaetales bacterium]|nr:hypothetical protein [Spirochaetales bacterium]
MKKQLKILGLAALLVLFISSCVVLTPGRTNNKKNSHRRVESSLSK